MSILPLVMLWIGSRSQNNASSAPHAAAARQTRARKRKRKRSKKSRAPRWPTPASPPPLPAFAPQTPAAAPAPSADPGQTSTPLAELATTPPKIVNTVKEASKKAAKRKIKNLLRRRLRMSTRQSTPMSTALVSQLQQILNRRGARLKQDGLYGPRTASAWSKIAKRKRLPTTIVREGPKIAKVATRTFEALNMPEIP